jgi:predicted nucleic acid-binding protein
MAVVVVFDTNILISALLSPGGRPFACLLLATARAVRDMPGDSGRVWR